MKIGILVAAALLLSACASSMPATITGECSVFDDPGFAVQGKRLKDKKWIGATQEKGIKVCGWKRPTE